MHIPGGSFVFNISWGSLPPAGLFALRRAAWKLLRVPATGSGATPSCARLALHRIVEAVEETNPGRSWAHAPTPVFDWGLS